MITIFKTLLAVTLMSFCIACGIGLKPRSLSTDPPSSQTIEETVDKDDEQNGPTDDANAIPDVTDADDETNMSDSSSTDDAEEASTSTENEGNSGASEDPDDFCEGMETMDLSCFEVYDNLRYCADNYYRCSDNCQDESCRVACEEFYYDCFQEEVCLGTPQARNDFYVLRNCEETYYYDCYDDAIEYYDECVANCSTQYCTDACGDIANDTYSACMIEGCSEEYVTCGLIDSDYD
tara:strand:+ start:227 stop:934 length:708 start_codon:yes stop_codon:yes gene_type:complete